MSVIKLTESGEFKISGLDETITSLYVKAFKSDEIKNYISGITEVCENHNLALGNDGSGCGDGVYCGMDGMKSGTVFALYYGTYRDARIREDVVGQDYDFDIVGKTEKYKNGLIIDGRGSGRRPDNLCCLNHSCDNANAELMRVRKAGVYLVVARTTRDLLPGQCEQITVNYNGISGEEGYWKKLPNLIKENPVIPADRQILHCLCRFPNMCPYNFARLVLRSAASDPLAVSRDDSDDSQADAGLSVVKSPADSGLSAVKSSADAGLSAVKSSENAGLSVMRPLDGAKIRDNLKQKRDDSEAAQTLILLSAGEKKPRLDLPDIILSWTSVPVKYSEFQKLDDILKKLWLTLYNFALDKTILASKCKGDEGFFGILGFVVPAKKGHIFNASHFPSLTYLRQKHMSERNSSKAKELQDEIQRVETIWKDSCFTEESRPDKSLVFSYRR
jgi:hypothetical protein